MIRRPALLQASRSPHWLEQLRRGAPCNIRGKGNFPCRLVCWFACGSVPAAIVPGLRVDYTTRLYLSNSQMRVQLLVLTVLLAPWQSVGKGRRHKKTVPSASSLPQVLSLALSRSLSLSLDLSL